MLIEPVILEYLKTKMSFDDIYMEVPKDRPEMFITIQKAGAGRTDLVDAITLEFHCYAPTKYESAALDNELKSALLGDGVSSYGITESSEISSCKFGGGNDAPDSSTKSYRYRSYYNLFY